MAKYCLIYLSVIYQSGGLERLIQRAFLCQIWLLFTAHKGLECQGEGRMVWRADGPGKRGALCLCVGDVQGDI